MRERATWLVAPVLLVVVASVQWWRVAQLDQTTWRGVGFGMFASFDDEANRRVRVEVELDGRRLPAGVPAERRRAADRLRTVPSTAATRRLAESLAQEPWRVVDGVARVGPGGSVADSVTIIVQGVEVVGGSGHPKARLVTVRRATVFSL